MSTACSDRASRPSARSTEPDTPEDPDAYIQDVMVHPDYQGQGIGTQLVKMAMDRLVENRIYMISVIFDPSLLEFYKKFGFHLVMAGQLENMKIR